MKHQENCALGRRWFVARLVLGLTPLAGLSILWAQDRASATGPVDVQLTAYKIVARGEKDELQAADKIKPGETIEYQARYANISKQGVKNLAATLPIPGGMEFIGGSAQPSEAQASTDGKNFALIPLKRSSKAADGSTKSEVVPLKEYRALRWIIGELPAGKSVTVFARVRVLGPLTTRNSGKNSPSEKEANR